MEITGHHTCRKSGGYQNVLTNAPFKSTISNGKIPFLGEGYYYWDYNILMAKKWGAMKYNNDYYVVETEIKCTGTTFLDLVGNRKDIKLFITMMEDFWGKGIDRENWSIGAFIEFMKRLLKTGKNKNVFPFNIIRCVDNTPRPTDSAGHFFFDVNREEYTNLDPRIAVCVIDKNTVHLGANKIIYPYK